MNTPSSSRGDGIRRARRVSNWTAAFLIAVTGAAAAAFAHGTAHPAGAGVTGVTGTTVSGSPVPGGAATGGGPRVSHSVATTTPSGVTITTTKQTVNGKTVITKVRGGHPRGDD